MNNSTFLQDVLTGLQSRQKYLESKYFYDKAGDELFQRIMGSTDYYLTRSEMDVFKNQKSEIADAVLQGKKKIDIIALGPGDIAKSDHLIRELYDRGVVEKFFPIDISENIINLLQNKIAKEFPGLIFEGMAGDYFDRLPHAMEQSLNPKLVLFVGATIGNFYPEAMLEFCNRLNAILSPGDMTLIGFDIKKDPEKILAAYNDREGWTAKFNLNLLTRINRELDGNFQIKNFVHYPNYDPDTGTTKSFLVSTEDQQVSIANTIINFAEGETIFMEVSQKYDLHEIKEAAQQSGFIQQEIFMDSRKYFVDVLWRVDN